MSWRLEMSTSLRFGPGVLGEVPALAAREGWRRLLLVSGPRVMAQPFAERLVSALEVEGVVVERWSDVVPDPRVGAVMACVERYRREGIDAVVGLGGGSAMDQAKATALGLVAEAPVDEMLAGVAPIPDRRLPLVLLPTTAGTGAEVSRGAILSDPTRRFKGGLRGRVLAADHALVDPECTYSLSAELTMATGFDVLTHGLETYLSRRATPFTALLSRSCLETVFRCLPRLLRDLSDVAAREQMAFAATMGGINLAASTTCLPHRMQYTLGARTGASHPEGLAALYPAWLEATRPFAVGKLADCATWIDPGLAGLEEGERAERFVSRIGALLEEIGLGRRLSSWGLDEAAARQLAGEVTGALDNDPGDSSPEALERLFVAAL